MLSITTRQRRLGQSLASRRTMSDIPPLPRKRSRRKYDQTKLPTPPPDPPKEDFLAYLDSLQSRTFAEDAFDHLDKLYKLMEQMLELREQNAKLHRRVKDLERLNNLERMQRELDVGDECPEIDKDTAFAETILESILADSKKKTPGERLRHSISKKRTRTGSEPEVKVCVDSGVKKTKVSKWTKVKAAFKWEKASPTVSDAKSQDSGIGVEVARYLRVPSCDEHGHSPVDSGAAEISTPGSLSSTSSTEDFNAQDQRSPCEDFRSSEDEFSPNYAHSKDGSQKSKHKTPWAKMKDIIQTRNSFKKKYRLSAHSDDVQVEETCSDNEDNVFEEEGGKEVPPEVVARYQKAIEDEESDSKKASKWIRVKNAFLPPPETDEDEIQRNYKQLQKKLSLEFQEKLNEWERMKQNSPCSLPSSSCGYVEDGKDPAFIKKMEEWQKMKSQPSMKKPSIQMTSEEKLPPEFRKKLQEWEKIRKNSRKEKKKISEVPRWKSLSGPRSDASPIFEYPPISDDFKKKLEEWKQIKAAAPEKYSPRMGQKDSSPRHSKKHKDTEGKEPHWLEKEMGKIEKEKQRLEQRRQKFLEREESLSKMRNSLAGGLKREVLIHTPSGFHRFEGISRKFTRRLYEWEKAQGIGPESSTFALLNSSLTPKDDKPGIKHKPTDAVPTLIRSKSADSIAISALNLACPLMSHQPSSLSLNDVDELEKECMADSKSSSTHFTHSHETLPQDEPEALIVEIEDIVEETAGPLHTYRIQQPVYQCQELKTMCEGETFAPKIRRSESTRAQNNYNLIEEVFSILKNLMENEAEISRTQETVVEKGNRNASSLIKLKMFDESQKAMASRLLEKVIRLQEANTNVFASITKDTEFNIKHVIEVLELVQDLSSEVYQLTEKLDSELNNRNVYDVQPELGATSLNPVVETAKDIKEKMLELRRRLSYICAASDLTAPRSRNSSGRKKVLRKTMSTDTEKEKEKPRLYIKSETSNTQSQGAIKKRIRYRQKSLQSRVVPDSDEDDDLNRNVHKKLTRTRSVSEAEIIQDEPKQADVVMDESIIQKVVVPTQSNILSITADETKAPDSPVTIFVKTTRKLFTPLVESSMNRDPDDEPPPEDKVHDNSSENSFTRSEPVTHLPPLPASPSLQRKPLKDISPSIRLMMAKYNQKLEESPSIKSGNSSGSASPVAWRSPTSERRVKTQTERYQEELKLIQKSVSASHVKPHEDASKPKRFSEERVQKLQKAKEEFLNATPPSSAPPQLVNEPIKFPARNRLSQISVGSESSADSNCGALMKSASAGMINVGADIYKQFEVHGGGYVSLPRNTSKPVGGLLGGKLSNIASKFRKVKMRKGKERDGGRMHTVSALCRQSLVVDIQENLDKDGKGGGPKDENVRSAKWTKLFKK